MIVLLLLLLLFCTTISWTNEANKIMSWRREMPQQNVVQIKMSRIFFSISSFGQNCSDREKKIKQTNYQLVSDWKTNMFWCKEKTASSFFKVQVGLVIRCRYVPLFWTTNTESADKKKTHFDQKLVL
jgi:hypothetical protein